MTQTSYQPINVANGLGFQRPKTAPKCTLLLYEMRFFGGERMGSAGQRAAEHSFMETARTGT